jgi:hypothetical protein
LFTKFFTPERANALIAALIIIGLALVAVSAIRFVDASTQLESNLAHKIQTDDMTLSLETPEEAQILRSSDLERRRLERQQNESLVTGGVGLATLAVAWLAHDIAQSRRKARHTMPSSPAEEGT